MVVKSIYTTSSSVIVRLGDKYAAIAMDLEVLGYAG
jgi:hypothetical protein